MCALVCPHIVYFIVAGVSVFGDCQKGLSEMVCVAMNN